MPGRDAGSGPSARRADGRGVGAESRGQLRGLRGVAVASAGADGRPACAGWGGTGREGTASNRAVPVEPAAFTAIPAAAGLPDFESGEIVRLGIDVTALPNYGIDIPAGAQSAVQADLLIGQDGQARAIRLVNANLE